VVILMLVSIHANLSILFLIACLSFFCILLEVVLTIENLRWCIFLIFSDMKFGLSLHDNMAGVCLVCMC
jgi:hypothetical protein